MCGIYVLWNIDAGAWKQYNRLKKFNHIWEAEP